MKVASVVERHPNKKLIHRLAIVDQFKGNHDAVGKDPARVIRAQELSENRSATAEDAFVNTHCLEKTREETKWSAMEEHGDVALKVKGKYGMDSRTIWFIAEDQLVFDRLNTQFP